MLRPFVRGRGWMSRLLRWPLPAQQTHKAAVTMVIYWKIFFWLSVLTPKPKGEPSPPSVLVPEAPEPFVSSSEGRAGPGHPTPPESGPNAGPPPQLLHAHRQGMTLKSEGHQVRFYSSHQKPEHQGPILLMTRHTFSQLKKKKNLQKGDEGLARILRNHMRTVPRK